MKKLMSEASCEPGRAEREPVICVRDLSVRAGARTILRSASFDVAPAQVLGLIGPSGAGKSTLLRCLNRLNDLIPGLQVRGEVRLHRGATYRPGGGGGTR